MAGIAAGAINTVVGSGTLVTFPVLLSVGYSPVVANVSNNIGLVPGAISGAFGYRSKLAGQRERVLTLGIARRFSAARPVWACSRAGSMAATSAPHRASCCSPSSGPR